MGLLCPRHRSDAGYRLYADEDLGRLEQILALKYLGLSLDEVRACLRAEPQALTDVLAQQKAQMREKRSRLDAILRAIEEAERALHAGRCDWDGIVEVVRLMQMEQSNEWVKKHFTEEQLRKMEELSGSAYSEEARRQLAERPAWTEADQQRAQEQWMHVASEARRLAAAGANPASPEAQAVAKLKCDLLSAFTQGQPEVEAGLQRFWTEFNALPKEQQPFDASPFDAGEEGNRLLDQAMEIYRNGQPSR